MKNLTPENIARVTGGTYYGPGDLMKTEISGVTKDSRYVEKGDLYIPFVGARVDGHSFFADVNEKGAMLCLSEQDVDMGDMPKGFAYVRVASTAQALKDIAAFYRDQLSCKIIGVIGSVGKTSTKEMLASVLSEHFSVQKTMGNLNNEIGMPLTLLSIRDQHEVAIVEMGISDFNEMERLSIVARPDGVVFTNIGYCHLENLGTRYGILKAKTEVLPYIKKGGFVVLNGDDDKLVTIKESEGYSLNSYGIITESEPAPRQHLVYAKDLKSLGLSGESFKLHFAGENSMDITLKLAGDHNVYNALAAASVGRLLDMSNDEIKEGLEKAETISGRNNHFTLNGITVIDDCYNANPVSMKASLKVLSEAPNGKIAILGDMGELGTEEKALHYEVGSYASGLNLDAIWCAGPLSKEIIRGYQDMGGKADCCHFDSMDELLNHIKTKKKTGDTLLIKASHFMGYDKIVAALKE